MKQTVHARMADLGREAKAAERVYSIHTCDAREPTFSDPESALARAKRVVRHRSGPTVVCEFDGNGKFLARLAYVWPSGQIDLTWRGSEIISCFPPKRTRAKAGAV